MLNSLQACLQLAKHQKSEKLSPPAGTIRNNIAIPRRYQSPSHRQQTINPANAPRPPEKNRVVTSTSNSSKRIAHSAPESQTTSRKRGRLLVRQFPPSARFLPKKSRTHLSGPRGRRIRAGFRGPRGGAAAPPFNRASPPGSRFVGGGNPGPLCPRARSIAAALPPGK